MNEIKRILEMIQRKVEDGDYVEAPQYIDVDFTALRDKVEELEEMIDAKLRK